MNQRMGTPKVSIRITTYNHEPFIAQAIESVLMQEVNFDYELIIGEDCSIDRTRQIVKDYQRLCIIIFPV
jgi:glycosyltransferase involved in cell wall biosynthesis